METWWIVKGKNHRQKIISATKPWDEQYKPKSAVGPYWSRSEALIMLHFWTT
uniref:Uncharacterized protein n=1 Tax=viral metagenome TaxID=1070528 RepID=A0A6M3X820_9ZZZZ